MKKILLFVIMVVMTFTIDAQLLRNDFLKGYKLGINWKKAFIRVIGINLVLILGMGHIILKLIRQLKALMSVIRWFMKAIRKEDRLSIWMVRDR